MLKCKGSLLLLLLILSTCQAGADSPNTEYVRENYIKHEYRIPMRDGVRLFTAVYAPKDTTKPHPIILIRTPYSCAPYGEQNYPTSVDAQTRYYFRRGYIRVIQDVRGQYMSEGEFVDVRPYKPVKRSNKDIDEASDTYDTVEWLVKNVKGNNGRVGIKGISYPGFYAWMGAIDAHPAVKATSPQAPVAQWMGGDDWYHNGAFLVSHAFDFYASFGWPRPNPVQQTEQRFRRTTPDGYKFFLDLGVLQNANTRYLHDSVAMWNNLVTHGTWDSFWKERSILPHLNNIRPATLVVGGWFDAENLYGALRSYETAEQRNPQARITLVMGPWAHNRWSAHDLDSLGDMKFGSNTTKFYTEELEGPFFEHYLNNGPDPRPAEAAVFLTGANEWKTFDHWPPKNVEPRNLYLHQGGTLSFAKPQTAGYREYVSDPEKPVPYTAEIRNWYNAAFMLEDQRFAARRPDVLVYESDILNEDVTIAGPVTVNLFASTSGTDCDWIVKIIDVFPDSARHPTRPNVPMGGNQMLVRGDVLRGKFRNNLSSPEQFQPMKPTRVSFTLQDAFHMFKKGHRIMVQVQSTWFPLIDRNPGKFMNIYDAKATDFLKTTQRVYSSPKMSSHVVLNVIK